MSMVTIAGQSVDADDPCALWQALYAYKLKVLTGEQVEEIEIRSPLTNRRTRFSPGNIAAIEAELRDLQRACDAKSGKRTRFAISGGFRPY
ncbi:hypothetical protein FHS55_002134 [Angulomicrobium tetraedrale]|uniref:Uncharacterized protein n=1 Tax=Ancylobacter tetraedralis TaxID=217068 RepID=A0A839Z9Y5_9HYPH|nr:hypothetical protein [Ancylobacter tetraedralis]MBB3771535.1 hypothetical protein [Ancylobacter tetraedralis]